jgi:broad specificity phosphatase PhoE
MTVILVRHGETAFNRDGIGLGRSDVALTERGVAQAGAVTSRLSALQIDRVITSPLARAAVIADGIALDHNLVAERFEALTELDVGETEGLEMAEMHRRFPEFLAQWSGADGPRARMPGGESIEDLAARLDDVVEQLRHAAEQTVVVVSHNFVLKTLLCRLLGLELGQFRSFQLDLASATFLTIRAGRVNVKSVNDTCHLSNLNLA